MSDKPSSTADHAQHQGLLDTQGYNTADGFKSLRDAGGNLGVESIGDQHHVTAYDSKTDTHHRVSNYGAFNTKADARNAIDAHNVQARKLVVHDNRPPASVDELERAAKSEARRAKEVEQRKQGGNSTGPFLDY